MEGTAALRGAAARWSLAGDQQLLDLLQEIHQRIITKCNETNTRLEEMSRGLRDASVNLQNVNNKFLALSNTQFVESRVYEDDADVAPPIADKAPPKVTDLASDLTKLKESLQILESYHEPLLIVRDSDSDTDSDGNDDRLVLKPKDLYADRPLPYIIGSQAWKSKWHAGLVVDESDSDSSTSKVEEVEQYSDSEDDRPTQDFSSAAQDFVPARKVSTGSSSLQSSAPASASPARPAPAPAPAAVAAELARRLGGDCKVPEREPVYSQPETVVRKLYKPQEPQRTTIFPDEPPPLDDQSSDDDIFAELHKTQPKPHSNTVDDLFDFSSKPNDLEEALFGPQKVQTNQIVDKPPLFEDSEPEVTEAPKTNSKEHSEENFKKPIGGISLFGTNKQAESIGAAILKRTRRKSSTSGDESNTEEVNVSKEIKPVKEVQEVKKERDIFDDLFAKSEKLNKKNAKTEVQTKNVSKAEVQPKEVKKKDVFSDIFDDIDDIFSSDIVNVQVKETKKNEKSLFSDDDDLFAEISKVNKDSGKNKVTASEESDLFSDVTPKVDKNKSHENPLFADDVPKLDQNNRKKESKVIKEIKESKSLFDSDSDDGLFTNVAKNVKQSISKTVKPVEYKLKDDLFDDVEDDGLFGKNNTKSKVEIPKNTSLVTEVSRKALFDSDDELFKDTKTNDVVKPELSENNIIVTDVSRKNDALFKKSASVSEKETEKPDIVNSVNAESKELKPEEVPENPAVINSVNNDSFNDEVPPPESPKESTTDAIHDSFDDGATYSTDAIAKNKTNETKDAHNSKNIEKISVMFDKLDEQALYKENILRTTRIASDDANLPSATKAEDLFNDSDDDFIKSKPKVPDISDKNSQKEETPRLKIEPHSPELFTTPSNKNDIFSDIFDDVPPAFEKPKEPKKSKNVNALFDDDSDDEALFFKKNDVITDEKPAFGPSEERFGIFNDEPPAIDVDFAQKPSKKGEIVQPQTSSSTPKSDDIPPLLTDDFPPKSINTDGITNKSVESNDLPLQEGQDATDNTSKEPKKIGKLKPMNLNINVNSLLPGASPKKKQVENVDIKQEQTASNEELHKTADIEPKMVKSISFDDPEILDNKISKERAKIQVKRRPSTRRARKEAARKSAIDFTDSSFDSSNDNSTKEEVKGKIVKTVYILNDDDIFGTSTTNETVPTKKHLNIVDSDEELFKTPIQVVTKDMKVTNDNQSTIERNPSVESDNNDIFKVTTDTTNKGKDGIDIANKHKNEAQSVQTELESNENESVFKDTQEKHLKIKSTINNADVKSFLDSDDGDDLFRQTTIKSSTVNILNDPKIDSDEDLFRTPPKTKTNIAKEAKSFLNSDDDDDLFKTKAKKEIKPVLKANVSSGDEDLLRNKGIATLGNVYKADDSDVKEHNIFDDFPPKLDEEDNSKPEVNQSKVATEIIEEKSVKVEKVKKSILDDLSDEDDLFKSKTKLVTRTDKRLFGDDDDDEDLFGTKSVKEVKPAAPILPTKEVKAAEPVFVDPLSLFEDND